MSRTIVRTNAFKKDVKRIKKQGKKLNKLWDVIESILEGKSLDPKHKPHRLSGIGMIGGNAISNQTGF